MMEQPQQVFDARMAEAKALLCRFAAERDITLNLDQLKKMAGSLDFPIRISKSIIHLFKERNPATNRLNSPIVAWVQSTRGNSRYEIKAHQTFGLSCNCPDWIYRMKPESAFGRTCKHCQKVANYIKVE